MKKLFKSFEFFCFVLVATFVALGLLTGCATATYHNETYDTSGNILSKTDATMKRPVGANMLVNWTKDSGAFSADASAQINGVLGNINTTLSQLSNAYARYQSGGLVNTPIIPAPQSTQGPLVSQTGTPLISEVSK
jgi:hypothetical protein